MDIHVKLYLLNNIYIALHCITSFLHCLTCTFTFAFASYITYITFTIYIYIYFICLKLCAIHACHNYENVWKSIRCKTHTVCVSHLGAIQTLNKYPLLSGIFRHKMRSGRDFAAIGCDQTDRFGQELVLLAFCGSINGGLQNGWFKWNIFQKWIRLDDLGVPHFRKPSRET